MKHVDNPLIKEKSVNFDVAGKTSFHVPPHEEIQPEAATQEDVFEFIGETVC